MLRAHRYDKSGIFRGRAAIHAYWVEQVRNKQRNIRFRQIGHALLWDELKTTATVKWEAAFEARRQDGTSWAPVQFVQVATLQFNSCGEIEALEEYWHSTSKSRQQQQQQQKSPTAAVTSRPTAPAAETGGASDAAAIAAAAAVTVAEVASPPPPALQCSGCGRTFSSRNQMFKHLRRPGECAQLLSSSEEAAVTVVLSPPAPPSAVKAAASEKPWRVVRSCTFAS